MNQQAKREILVSAEYHQKKVSLLEGGELEEFYIEHEEARQLVGSIYKGKVSSIIPGINAAFISIGLEKNGFLYVTDVIGEEKAADVESIELEAEPRRPVREDRRNLRITDVLKKDQDVLVQVVKEPFGTKGARLTCQITLPGRYVVLMPYHSHRGISKRIEDRRERDRIREMLRSIEIPREMGLIVRTAAWGSEREAMARDIQFLLHQWKLVKKRAAVVQAPHCVHEEHDLVLRMVRDVLNERFHSITVDSPEEYRRVHRYMKAAVPGLLNKMQLYKGEIPLFQLKNVEREIERIFDAKAPLKSGGSIVIEQTEALVSIDVNTGKFTGKRNLEDTAFRTNCEAAREIAKQIRLRDLGGIIIVDFIDMDDPDHRREVLRILEDALRKDRAKTSVLSISQLGLVEMTRQRIRKSLESTHTQECPYCHGKGMVKSNRRLAIEALQRAQDMLKSMSHGHIEISILPEVAEILMEGNRGQIRELERKTHNRISVMVDPHLHPEEIRLKRILDKRHRAW